jgi:DUF4097 and DUF4098 domain-containing protein YvlB
MLMLGAGMRGSLAGEKTFEKVVPADPRGTVEISNVSGRIDVSGWERPEVSVHAELGSDVERVEVSSGHGHTTVKVNLTHHLFGGGGDGDARLHVQVPKDSELSISAVSADVGTTGVQGVQRISAVSGDVTAELGGADLELKTVSGNIRLRGHGEPARLHVTSVSGDVHLEHGAGELEAGTVSGNLVVSLDSARSVRVRSTSGDLRFDGKLTRGADFDASTVSGDLTVHAAADAGYTYEVSTFSGQIENCFQQAVTERSHGPGRSLEGSRGEGAGRVHVKAMGGDIHLCDHP